MTTTNYQEQAEAFLADTKTKLSIVQIGYGPYFDDDKESRNVYRFTLKRNGKSYTGRFGASLDMTRNGMEPTTYDILSCLTQSDPGTFEQFCGDMGYDVDSRRAERTYKAVVKEWAGVARLFGDVLEQLQEIQ